MYEGAAAAVQVVSLRYNFCVRAYIMAVTLVFRRTVSVVPLTRPADDSA